MVRLFDNTLRDGGNVVGHGFPISLTQSIIGALLEAGIPDIECGNCKGLGAYAKADAKQAPSDEEYFEAVQPYLSRGRIGMFVQGTTARAKTSLLKRPFVFTPDMFPAARPSTICRPHWWPPCGERWRTANTALRGCSSSWPWKPA